jgi:transposase
MMLEKGFTTREIVVKIDCKSHITIVRLKKKYEETGKVQNKPSSGHSRKLNEYNKRNIVKNIMIREYSCRQNYFSKSETFHLVKLPIDLKLSETSETLI